MVADPAGDSAGSDVREVSVVWDGGLLVAVTYAQAPRSPRLSLLVSSAAKDEHDPAVAECDPALNGTVSVTVADHAAELVAGRERLTAEPRWDGLTVRYVFPAPRSVKPDAFACLGGSADGDGVYGAFAGRTLKLTPQSAREGARAALARRYGTRFTRSSRVTVRCLQRAIAAAIEEVEDGVSEAARAGCAFEFRLGGGTYRAGQLAIFLANGVPQPADVFSRTFPLGLRSCGTTDFSGRWLMPPFPPDFGGASMSVWAQRVDCVTARRVARRPGGRRGWRCVTTNTGYEFVAVRCTRPGGRVVRIESGA
jgi:hypothetical protein